MASRLPKPSKPAEALRRRNQPEQWVVLPVRCGLPVPTWPSGSASKPEADLWKRLWVLPVAEYWHSVRVEPAIVARYVRLSIAKPEHATVGQLERELGLTPASMLRMRLTVEEPEAKLALVPDPYAHLKQEYDVK